ncbi:TetR/AcrR family transcriptional regulator [Mycolicibacterium moriokaense]|nr:TetR/AcrR family transcriptional regulator [Mycolicibacterium moriokaense]
MTPRRGGRRLSADDWIEAGFAVLADGGPNALRIDALCERLDVTKGSFYWHFTDMPAYRGALVEAWGTLHDRNRRPFENMPDVDPRERLDVMMRTLVAPKHWALERAMRVWALTDDAALASVQQSDGRVVRAVRQAFIDFGFEPEDAALRALVVYASGVGLMHTSGSTPSAPPELRDRFLDFMLRP